MAAGDTYELAVKGICANQQIVTVHHFRAEAAGDLAATIAGFWEADCKATYRGMLPADYSVVSIACRQINPPGPVGVDIAATPPNGGVFAATAGGMNVAMVLTWTTSYIGRSRRGRSFIGPVTSQQVISGVIQAATVTAGQAYVTAILASFGNGGTRAATARFVVWSRRLAGLFSQNPPPAMGSSASASAYIVSGRTNTIARSQRDRELGRGS